MVKVAESLAQLRGLGRTDPDVAFDAALAALSGRIRLHESCQRTPEEIIRELWDRIFGATDRDEELAVGSALSQGDDGDAAVRAVLDALNRRLPSLLGSG